MVVVSKRYSYAKHRKSRFEHQRETDDPTSDSDDNIRRMSAEVHGGMFKCDVVVWFKCGVLWLLWLYCDGVVKGL